MFSIDTLLDFLKFRIQPLSDPVYQKRVWIKQEGKEVEDYDEASSRFLEESEKIFAHPTQYEGVDENILQALQKLYEKVSVFDDNVATEFASGQDEDLIVTPEWQEIQQLALETYEIIMRNLKERNYDPGTSL